VKVSIPLVPECALHKYVFCDTGTFGTTLFRFWPRYAAVRYAHPFFRLIR
jgi:hypothetical protein